MPPIPPRPNFEVLSRPATKPFSRSESAILRAFEELDDLKDKYTSIADRLLVAEGGAQDALIAEGLGLEGWSYPISSIGGSSLMVHGTLCAVLTAFRAGAPVNGITVLCTTAGTSMSLTRFAIMETDGTILAATNNSATLLETTGARRLAFPAPWDPPASGVYYIGCLSRTNGTMPQLSRSVTVESALINNVRVHAAQRSLTDLPSPDATLGATGAMGVWYGWD